MGRLRPGQQDAAGCNELAKRVLKQNYSDITEDSMGLPALASNFVTPEKKKMNSMSSPSVSEVSLLAVAVWMQLLLWPLHLQPRRTTGSRKGP